jgi:predicted DNA-binding transcriptional regulator YafY
MSQRQSKNNRVLDMYERLCAGKVLRKAEEAQRFGIDQRSVQRDIDDIRAFLDERAVAGIGDQRHVVYDRQQKGFLLRGYQSPLMTNSEILAVSKILLESRAFSKKKMSTILDKLISGCVPQKNMKLVTDLLANEKYHYVELTNPAGIQEKLWDIGSDIQQRRLLEISYQRQDTPQPPVARIVEPVSILFSEYYFYLNAYIVEPNESGAYTHKYDYPAIFRMDRIADYRLREETFRLPYADRFQEGEFRKRVQFMYPGKLQNIRFRYTGSSVEAILDRLPTAKIQSQAENGIIIEAEVYGNGILMWLLSQGDRVEVLAPQKLRQEMKEILLRMLEQYQN